MFDEDPSLSVRKASVAASISYSLCWRILLNDLKLKQYKYQSAHQLLPPDYQKRVNFAEFSSNSSKVVVYLFCEDLLDLFHYDTLVIIDLIFKHLDQNFLFNS